MVRPFRIPKAIAFGLMLALGVSSANAQSDMLTLECMGTDPNYKYIVTIDFNSRSMSVDSWSRAHGTTPGHSMPATITETRIEARIVEQNNNFSRYVIDRRSGIMLSEFGYVPRVTSSAQVPCVQTASAPRKF